MTTAVVFQVANRGIKECVKRKRERKRERALPMTRPKFILA